MLTHHRTTRELKTLIRDLGSLKARYDSLLAPRCRCRHRRLIVRGLAVAAVVGCNLIQAHVFGLI